MCVCLETNFPIWPSPATAPWILGGGIACWESFCSFLGGHLNHKSDGPGKAFFLYWSEKGISGTLCQRLMYTNVVPKNNLVPKIWQKSHAKCTGAAFLNFKVNWPTVSSVTWHNDHTDLMCCCISISSVSKFRRTNKGCNTNGWCMPHN